MSIKTILNMCFKGFWVFAARNFHWDVVLCLALIPIAIVLRAGPLGPWSLWRDDAWQALAAKAGTWAEAARIGQTAPGFSVLLTFWLMLAGFSSVAAQALPFVAGVAGAPLAYLLAKRCGFGMAGATAAGLAIALSPAHATFSTRVKSFTLEADFAMLLLLLGVHGLEEPDRTRRWVVLLLAGVLGTVFSATLLPVTLAAALAVTGAALSAGPCRPWPAAVSLVALALFSLFWSGWWLAPAVHEPLSEVWSESFIPLNEGMARAVTAAWLGTERFLQGLSPLPVRFTGPLLALGVILLVRRTPWLGVLCILPLVIAVVMAAMDLAPYGAGRTEIYFYPFMALILAAPVDVLSRFLPAHGGLLAFVLAVAPLASAQRADGYPAEDIRSIVGVVDSESMEGDAVIVYPQDGYIYALYSRFPVRFLNSDLSMTGFTVGVDHPGRTTLILAPHSDYRLLKQHARGVRENSSTIRALFTGGHSPQRVWFAARSDGRAIPTFKSILLEAGLKPARAWRFRGADLTLWTRAG